MDATILTVLGTGLTAIGTGVALFVALWKVQGSRFDAVDRRWAERFDAVDRRFDAADKRWAERFDAVDRRFDMAEKLDRERFEAMDRRWAERFDMAENANRERFEMAEKQNQAAHAAICDSIGKVDQRLDDLYRHLLGAPAKTDLSGPAPAAG